MDAAWPKVPWGTWPVSAALATTQLLQVLVRPPLAVPQVLLRSCFGPWIWSLDALVGVPSAVARHASARLSCGEAEFLGRPVPFAPLFVPGVEAICLMGSGLFTLFVVVRRAVQLLLMEWD